MIGRVIRLRAALNLSRPQPLLFLARSGAIYNGLNENKLIFVPNPTLPVLLGQIQDATAAQANVGKVAGAATIRNVKFAIVVTSMESERMMVQALCDANPAQAAAMIAAASMVPWAIGEHFKPLLAAKNGLPSGTVLLDANASLLDQTYRQKTYNWQSTLDGKVFTAQPSTPTAKTSIANLVPLTTVGFQVSVTIHKQPQGPWSQTVSILVR